MTQRIKHLAKITGDLCAVVVGALFGEAAKKQWAQERFVETPCWRASAVRS